MEEALHPDRKTWRITLDAHHEGVKPFNQAERRYVQRIIPGMCARGGWRLRCCAAGPESVSVLADVSPQQTGDKVRRQMERWLTESLNNRFARRTWWTEAGHVKQVADKDDLNTAYPSILGERA